MKLTNQNAKRGWIGPLLFISAFAIPPALYHAQRRFEERDYQQNIERQKQQRIFAAANEALRSRSQAIERFFSYPKQEGSPGRPTPLDELQHNLMTVSGRIVSDFQLNQDNLSTWPENLDSDDRSYTADALMPSPMETGPLRRLMLSSSKIDDDKLALLRNQTHLEELWLDYTFITDAGLEHLVTLANLKHLHVNGTAISSDGLITVAEIPSLSLLYVSPRLRGTRGINYLNQNRPDIHIVFID